LCEFSEKLRSNEIPAAARIPITFQTMNDTIAAIATPFGEGAIALIRLSGPAAINIAMAVFRGQTPMLPRVQHYGKIVDGGRVVDDVLLCLFPGPASYTGEDLVEISCHGGILISRQVLKRILDAGARLADPGEFTQRAFLNNKLDLTQAEAVMDVIHAQTELSLRAAREQLAGGIGRVATALREELLTVLAHVEAFIDFPDEDITPDTSVAWDLKLENVQTQLAALLATADRGRILREGVRTVISGAPNAGKSSLLNALLGRDRAIVSPTPGTTRDMIEETLQIGGIPIRLIDTAGLRISDDAVEREGIARAQAARDDADLVLQLFDGTLPAPEPLPAGNRVLCVRNKCDLPAHESWGGIKVQQISCTTGEGVETLCALISSRVLGGTISADTALVSINLRHQQCFEQASVAVKTARRAISGGLSAELVSVDLRAAMDSIGEVVGKADTEDLLSRIFSTFCLGK